MYQQAIYAAVASSYDAIMNFHGRVLADGGTFDRDMVHSAYYDFNGSFRTKPRVLIIPGAYASGKIYGMVPSSGQIVEFSFTRTGVATYFDKNGIMQIAASGFPRIDHDPVSKTMLGYLVENAATNLCTYSNDFTQWSGDPSKTVSGNTSYGRAMTIIAKTTSGSSESLRHNTISSSANTTYCFRITLRAGTSGRASLGIGTGSDATGGAWGDNGATGARIVRGPGVLTRESGSRHEIAGLTSTEDTVIEIYRSYVNASVSLFGAIYPGGITSTTIGDSVKVSTVQMQVGNECGSQIDTNGSQVTRSGEMIQSNTDIISYSSASVYMDFKSLFIPTSGQSVEFASKPGAGLFMYAVNDYLLKMYDGTNLLTTATTVTGTSIKVTSSYGAEGIKINANGGGLTKGAYDGGFGSGALRILRGNFMLKSYLKSLAIFDSQLTDAEHISITS